MNSCKWRLRDATIDDLASVVEVDTECFPVGEIGAQAAAPGELERGVSTGQCRVAVDDADRVIAFCQTEQVDDDVVYISGLGVSETHRRMGIATALLSELAESRQHLAPTLIASVRASNIAMIRVLCSVSFLGSRYLPDYFGDGIDRLLFTRSPEGLRGLSGDIEPVPVGNLRHLRSLVDSGQWLIRDVVVFPHGDHFDMRRQIDDQPGLLANETSVSVSFAGIILAAATFLLGFGMTGSTIRADILWQLTASVVGCTVALTIYANSTGELSRMNPRASIRYLQIGNILSEFGGVILLLQVLPVTLASSRPDSPVGAAACVFGSLAILGYQLSEFDILSRYTHRYPWRTRMVGGTLAMSPVIGYGVLALGYPTDAWSLGNIAFLVAVTAWCLFIPEESSRAKREKALD